MRNTQTCKMVNKSSTMSKRVHDQSKGLLNQEYLSPEVVSNPQKAFYPKKMSVPPTGSVGYVCGEFIMCYPPGIPILVPGERITDEIIRYIEYAKE